MIPNVRLRDIDKAVHFSMYAVLGFLIARAMHDPPRTSRVRVLVAALLLCVAIGATDEWHQKYMKGRSADRHDLAADSLGGLTGAFVWTLRSRRKAIRTT